MQMENIELKSCPFCGSDDVDLFGRTFDGEPDGDRGVLNRFGIAEDKTIELVYTPENQTLYGVMCTCCHIETGVEAIYLTEMQAAAAWNRRVAEKS